MFLLVKAPTDRSANTLRSHSGSDRNCHHASRSSFYPPRAKATGRFYSETCCAAYANTRRISLLECEDCNSYKFNALNTPTTKPGNRIAELDGLRGLAILLVVAFHYCIRWAELLPYGDAFGGVALFKYGYLGVELFFMISGYVIFMSLDGSTGLWTFARKRWLRLFPAMLIVSVGVLLTAPLLWERPLGLPRVRDALPGLTFIPAKWYVDFLHLDVKNLENVFWSLYVEVRFYGMVSVLYFTVGRRITVLALAALAVVATALELLVSGGTLSGFIVKKVLYLLGDVLIGQHLAWFVVGILTYMSTRKELGQWGYAMVLPMVALALADMPSTLAPVLMAIALTVIFLLVMWHQQLLGVFRWRLFAFFGAISYPLYLFHENAGIALIIKLGNQTVLPSMLLPVLVLALMALLGWIIATYLEPALHGVLRRVVAPASGPRPPAVAGENLR